MHVILLDNNNLDTCRVSIDFKTKLLQINYTVLFFSIKYTLTAKKYHSSENNYSNRI
jgi:hypothetical protein